MEHKKFFSFDNATLGATTLVVAPIIFCLGLSAGVDYVFKKFTSRDFPKGNYSFFLENIPVKLNIKTSRAFLYLGEDCTVQYNENVVIYDEKCDKTIESVVIKGEHRYRGNDLSPSTSETLTALLEKTYVQLSSPESLDKKIFKIDL